jgi:oxygen-independent coproporphyrinogen-3 oxidase
MDALEAEVAQLTDVVELDTLFFGGGTPSHLTPPQLIRLKQIVESRFVVGRDAEVTAECNPNDIDAEKIDALIGLGVNRISLGVQSLNADKLKRLERDHSADDVSRAIDLAQRGGISSVSMDLIFAAPSETLSEWCLDLDAALALEPDHISTYELTYEKGTQFWNRLRRGDLAVSDEEVRADMYEHSIERLEAGGWQQYELSSFAKAGHQCRHNKNYWNGDDYLAFGSGASRFVGGQRSTNHQSPLTYMKRIEAGECPAADVETLAGIAAARERLVVGLRLLGGVNIQSLKTATGFALDEVLDESKAQVLLAHKLIELTAGVVRLTKKGVMLCDSVAGLILKDDVGGRSSDS